MGAKITQPKARIKTGLFAGDGNATQAITGIGFKGTALFVFKHHSPTAGILYHKNDQMGANAYATLADAYSVNIIISLDNDGFTVGNQSQMNMLGYDYSYVIFRD